MSKVTNTVLTLDIGLPLLFQLATRRSPAATGLTVGVGASCSAR